MKIKITLFTICYFIIGCISAQNTLNGKVVDSNGDGVFFATIALIDATSGDFAKSTTTDDFGNFKFERIQDGSYFIVASMLGYDKMEKQPLSFPDDNNRSLNITLRQNAELLKEIVVEAEIPLIEQKADRLVLNVENSVLGSNGSFLDVIRLVPGIMLTSRGLRMAGQSNITIYINGKPTQYMDVKSLLRDMPASNIKQIEVIHQPGAEFEASGSGPILNVILKKKNLLGTNGWVASRVQKDYKWLYGGAAFLSHYKDNLNFNCYVGYTSNAQQEILEVTRRIKNDIYTQSSTNPNNSNNLTTNMLLNWDFTEKQTLGITGQFNTADNDQLSESLTDIQFETGNDVSLISTNEQVGNVRLYTVNPYYSIWFDTSSHKLDVDFNYFKLNSTTNNDIRTKFSDSNDFFPGQTFEQPGETQVIAAKVDYSKPLSKILTLNAGLKYSVADLQNDLTVRDEVSQGEWEPNTSQSNFYKFKENLGAAYTKLSLSGEKWNGTVGLRFEDSNTKGVSVTTGDKRENRITKLFPSFSVQRSIAGPISASLAYSYRIDRPGYFELNPFRKSYDPFTGTQGNPILLPALTHSFNFNVIFKSFSFFTASYKLTNDPMVEVTSQNDDTGETILTTVNLDKQKVFNAQFMIPLDFIYKPVKGFAGIIVNHNQYDSQYLAQSFLRDRWTYNIFLRAKYTLPADIDFEFSTSYTSGLLDGVLSIKHFYNLQLGASRQFLDDKLRLSVDVSDVFFRYRHGEIKFANMDIDFVDKWYTPRITFSLSYKFGNKFLNKEKIRALGAENEIKRSKKNQ